MKAVILGGGLGTRLRPVTYEIPKPLVPVNKKPIVNYLIDLFARYGCGEVCLLVSRAHELDFMRWKKAWADELPYRHVSICFEEKPRGTFGGLEQLQGWIGNEAFFLSNGDELKDFNLDELKNFHEREGGVGTIALVEVPNAHEYGVPLMDGSHVVEFLEKPAHPPSRFISSGLYLLEPSVFAHADFRKEHIMIEKDIFPKLAREGKLMGFPVKGGRWYDCGTLERWEKAMQEW